MTAVERKDSPFPAITVTLSETSDAGTAVGAYDSFKVRQRRSADVSQQRMEIVQGETEVKERVDCTEPSCFRNHEVVTTERQTVFACADATVAWIETQLTIAEFDGLHFRSKQIAALVDRVQDGSRTNRGGSRSKHTGVSDHICGKRTLTELQPDIPIAVECRHVYATDHGRSAAQAATEPVALTR